MIIEKRVGGKKKNLKRSQFHPLFLCFVCPLSSSHSNTSEGRAVYCQAHMAQFINTHNVTKESKSLCFFGGLWSAKQVFQVPWILSILISWQTVLPLKLRQIFLQQRKREKKISTWFPKEGEKKYSSKTYSQHTQTESVCWGLTTEKTNPPNASISCVSDTPTMSLGHVFQQQKKIKK